MQGTMSLLLGFFDRLETTARCYDNMTLQTSMARFTHERPAAAPCVFLIAEGQKPRQEQDGSSSEIGPTCRVTQPSTM